MASRLLISSLRKGYQSRDSGCHDAENGRLGDMQDDPTLLSGSDHYADSEECGAG